MAGKGEKVKGAGRKGAVRAKPKPKLLVEETSDADGLTTKQRLFVECYLSNGFNATEAARQAGYGGDDRSLAVIGHENLRKLKIAALVRERIDEAVMPANEVMARLTAIARGRVTDFLDEGGKFDLKAARKAEKDGLLKKLKQKRTSKRVDVRTEGNDENAETIETSLVYEEIEFELYSAHEALRDLGAYHQLLGKTGGSLNLNLTPDQLATMSEEEIDVLIAKLSGKRR